MQKQIAYYESKLAYEMDPSDLYHALQAGEDIIVIDARQAAHYEREHIPGAINLPHREMNEKVQLIWTSRKCMYVIVMASAAMLLPKAH